MKDFFIWYIGVFAEFGVLISEMTGRWAQGIPYNHCYVHNDNWPYSTAKCLIFETIHILGFHVFFSNVTKSVKWSDKIPYDCNMDFLKSQVNHL